MADINISATIDNEQLQAVLGNFVNIDDELLTFANQSLARYCDPYVPKESGTLQGTTDINAQRVRYSMPYAHYQYTGEVYGLNILIKDANGIIVGWFSLPNTPKFPTGRHINYSDEVNPLATDHWDQAAMADHLNDLIDELRNFIAYRGGS